MKNVKRHDRFVPPIMQAFRAAFREKDSQKKIDLRSESDERVIAGRRSSPRNAVNENVLKQELSQDLAALLNTVNLAAAENLDGLDYVKQSILNFGVSDMTAFSAETHATENVQAHLKEVLQRYEIRLAGQTLEVSKSAELDEVNMRLSFHVSAEMYATPTDVPVEFVADIESYSGKMNVKRL